MTDEIGKTDDRAPLFTSRNSTPRALYLKHKEEKLRDFFLIYRIGADQAEQITQDLVDADYSLRQLQDAMVDRHLAEDADLIAQGAKEGVYLTPEEQATLKAEREIRYRQALGGYYDAHEDFLRSYPHRRRVQNFSSRLPEPLEYTAEKTLVQIFDDETSKLRGE